MITLTVNGGQVIAKLSRISDGVRPRLTRAINAAAIDLQAYIRREKLHGQVLKSRTGNLSRAIAVTPAVDHGSRIVASVRVDRTAPYGRIQEEGVAHTWVITPRVKKALRFEVGGKVVFAKRVTHPGLKPKPFMKSALEEKRAEILERIRAAVREGIR